MNATDLDRNGLTYQPFANAPQLDVVRQNLRMNISNPERALSAVGGVGLIAGGLALPGWAKWLLVGLGTAFLQRGWSGHCAVNERLGRDTRRA